MAAQGYQPPPIEKPQEVKTDNFDLLDIDFSKPNQQDAVKAEDIQPEIFSGPESEIQINLGLKSENSDPSNKQEYYPGFSLEDDAEKGNLNPSEETSKPNQQEELLLESKTPVSNYLKVFTVEYYRKSFDFTTDEIVSRFFNSAFPIKPDSIFGIQK